MTNNKTKDKIQKISLVKMIIFLCIIIFLCVMGFVFETQIEHFLNPVSFSYNNINNENLNIYYLNVGQGDCAFINFPDGKTMLVDSGTPDSEEYVIDFLINKIYKNRDLVIDYVLLTHSDTDHSGGLLKVMQTFQVKNVFRPKIYDFYYNSQIDYERDENKLNYICKEDSVYYHNLIESFYNEPYCNVYFIDIEQMNTNLKICSSDIDNYYDLKFYAPLNSIINTKNVETNEFSPIFTINYKNKIAMFTGDASSKIEKEALHNFDLPKVDILKVAHHGSKSSTCEEFVNRISPLNAVISVGKNNSYGHPTNEVINLLINKNCSVYRTDEEGSIIFTINNNGEITNFNDNVFIYFEMEYLLIVGVLFCGILLQFVEITINSAKKTHKKN